MAPPNFHLELLSPKIQFNCTLFFRSPPSTLSVTIGNKKHLFYVDIPADSSAPVALIPGNNQNRGQHLLWFSLNSVYTRSGQNSTPNSNATNLHSSQKRCCSFCISSSNASPTFQVQKSIFHQMTKPIQVTVILPLLLAISFSRNDDIHSSISGISNDLIGVIPTIGQ